MEHWYSFKLIKEPVVGWDGNVSGAAKRVVFSNRKSKLTYGGEWVCPDLSGYNLINRYQRDDTLIVKTDSEISDKDKNITSIRKYGNVEIKVSLNFKDFKVKEISEAKAKEILTEWDVWVEKVEEPESGVT